MEQKTYQLVITSKDVDFIVAVTKALQDLQAQYPGISAELYETKKL